MVLEIKKNQLELKKSTGTKKTAIPNQVIQTVFE